MYRWNDDREWPLVGRDDELEACAGLLSGVRPGLVFRGPLGAGKSRLAAECLSRAAAAGFRTTRVTCSEAAQTVPFGAIAHLLPPDVGLADPVTAFHRVADTFAVRAGEPGRVLMIDDLHLMDGASAVLLRQLADTGVARYVATLRGGAPACAATSALCGSDAVRHVDLQPLTRDDVAELLHRVLGGPAGQRTVHEFFTASGGNALFLHELVVNALRRQMFRSDGRMWEVSEYELCGTARLRDIVRRLLASANRPLVEMVALCAPVSLADAEHVAPLPELIDVEAAGLLRVDRDGRRTMLSFAHPLYAETARADIPVLRHRAVLLEAVAQIESYGGRRREDALRIASYRLAATGTADPALLRRAATIARQAHDYPHAIRLLRAVPEAGRTLTDTLLVADSLVQMGSAELAEEALTTASAQAATDEDRVRVTLIRTRDLFWRGHSAAGALELSRRTQAGLASEDLRAVLDLNEGGLQFALGNAAEAVRLLDVGDPGSIDPAGMPLWLLAAGPTPDALVAVGRTADAVEWARRAYEANLRNADHALLPHAATHLTSLGSAQAEAGDLVAAREALRRAFTELLDAGAGLPRAWAAIALGRTELLAGQLGAAQQWYREAASLTRGLGYRRAYAIATAGLAAVAGQQGKALPDATAEVWPVDVDGRVGRAWTLAASGALTEARALLTRAVTVAREFGAVTDELYLLTEIARLGGAADVSARAETLAAACDGRLAAARVAFITALAANDPHRLLDAAALLRETGAELVAAESANCAALAFAADGEARRAAAATALARHDGAATPLLAVRDTIVPLTGREREIALRAASGASSRDIARSLTLSVRTVDNHLTRAYTKLGVAGRRELAQAMNVSQ
ncbi:LuxR C-terminal-related transcriptional regulator [Paractinoplanes toevensis]|uniref:LuxR family transcriptional regulator n=1 Tax=Paractinoplanes toevensis TaxID=571911 RepID=A0A919TES4_9ACTN|nr:LuxR C-terminal-related transcriptional regulator [Actinoplanes toevensis]GIM93511.1 LuxR family transcriptional regulator [Actinoplanes toevensis]